MDFRIADTFSDSLARLTGEEQKAVKTTAFDLQLNPANPGMNFHKLDKARDKNFWSVRVSRDVRLIVHRTEASLLLCYVDHHDKAYAWAERRKLETHPKTGAAQWVEIRETVQKIVIPEYVAAASAWAEKPLFVGVRDEQFLSYGVPPEWLRDVRQATEESLLSVADHLPREAAEALLELATGGKPRVPAQVSGNPFEHPDALSRFRVMVDVAELQRALEYPWDKWTVFLHPEQRQWVERDYNGPARVSGSAGTGKTIVALHRAVFLARTHPDARVLLATFSETLADALRTRLRRLISNEPRLGERLEVHAIDSIALRLYELQFGPANIATPQAIAAILSAVSAETKLHKFTQRFLQTEWEQVVDAWQIESWEQYRDVTRLGRKTRLSDQQRKVLWSMFEKVRAALATQGVLTLPAVFKRLAAAMAERKSPPFDFAVVDEAQDLSVAQVRFLAAMGAKRPDALFLAGDEGQRIFQQPFSWKALGVDIRGRSRTLRVNYRTSHQIRAQADRLLDSEVSDADGNTDERKGTVSVFNGPPPIIRVFASEKEEIDGVATWLSEQKKAGMAPHEVGVFVRSAAELPRARAAVGKAGLAFKVLDDDSAARGAYVSVSTMHLAKGLEFRSVAVMASDDEIIPSQLRIETAGDETDLEEVYTTERHLLYVAATRARDHLFISGVEPASEFLDDMRE
jgi:superfamily I DNA/RNA helicase/mRNA-degrading endonuclease RelE of RelBE toxin-antitoxin system